MSDNLTILQGDVRATLLTIPAKSVHCLVTSPPYWALRSYVKANDPLKCFEMGSEATPGEFVAALVGVFGLVRRVMRDDGVVFVNLGDTYAGSGRGGGDDKGNGCQTARDAAVTKFAGDCRTPPGLKPMDRVGIPERFALAMQADGWWWRDTIMWVKPAPMPMSFNGVRWEKCRVKVKAGGRGGNGNARMLSDGNRIAGGYSCDTAPNAEWSDCPGCPKCLPNGGYVLRRGSWRTTPAHEPIFMFTKSQKYFCDAFAAREPAETATIERNKYTRVLDDPDEQFAVKHDHETTSVTRNPRSVWTISSGGGFNGMVKSRVLVDVSPDDVDGDTLRITSPNCPIHGDHPTATVFCGEPQSAFSSHNGHTDFYPLPTPSPSHHPTQDPSLVESEPSQSSDRVATAHNTASNRMDRETATTPACIPSEGTSPDIARTSTQHAELFQHHDNPANNTLADSSRYAMGSNQPEQKSLNKSGKGKKRKTSDVGDGASPNISENKTATAQDGPSARIDPHNQHKSSCKCSFKKEIIKETSHYATFPIELPRRLIEVATSAHGVCAECGAQWARIINAVFKQTGSVRNDGKGLNAMDNRDEYPRGVTDLDHLGWKATCTCDAPRVPATVLDIFGGSGTTAEAAIGLGRRAILCELNPEYVGVIRQRLGMAFPLLVRESA